MSLSANRNDPSESGKIDKKREENKPSSVSLSTEKAEEKRLIVAVQNGDKEAFGSLIRKEQKRLFRFVYGLLGSFDQTEDIVQESFVKAFEAIMSFRTEYSFYPWLATIARNLAYNHLRREEKKESLDRLEEKGFDPETADLGPLEELIEKENGKRFYLALEAMPAKFRVVFVLRQFEKMDYAKIASYLKIPPGTVDSRLYRARKFLMEELGDLL